MGLWPITPEVCGDPGDRIRAIAALEGQADPQLCIFGWGMLAWLSPPACWTEKCYFTCRAARSSSSPRFRLRVPVPDRFASMRAGDGWRAPVALVIGGALAGGNAVAIRYTNRELEPLFGAGARFAVAAALLGVVVWVRRLPFPRGGAATGAAVFGVLNFAGAFGFAYYALVHMKAGAASTLLALTPLMTLTLAAMHRLERIRPDGVVGGGFALVGVALLSGASLSGSVPVLSVVAALASVVCFAEAAVLVRRSPPVSPLVMNAVAMAVGAVVLLGASAVAGETWTFPDRRQTWVAFVYLVMIGSIVVFLLYLFVLGEWEASRAVYFDVIIPPVAVALSVWLDDEAVTPGLVLGGALVLLGAHVGALRHAGDTATS